MTDRSRLIRSILAGGAAVALLDALDAVTAYGIVAKLSPLTIYQFVASGLLGPAAYQGGLATAMVGVAVHCAVALSVAASFTFAAWRLPWLLRQAPLAGAAHGLLVYGFMNLVVVPLSRIPPAPMPLSLLLNGLLGHVLLVGMPAALVARHYLGNNAVAKRSPADFSIAPR